MKSFFAGIIVVSMFLFAGNASAAGSQTVGVGLDVLIPTGKFGDAYGVGFGGSARYQYNVNNMFSATGTVGYFSWSGKDFSGVTGPSFKGFTIRAGGKYYFVPAGTRFYGLFELGLFFSSVDVPSYTLFGQTFGGGSVSSTDFLITPVIGVEIPAGPKNSVDASVRYELILSSGDSAGSIGFRVAYNFGL